MNRKGQALVEFIIIVPIFLMILFSIIDFGFIFSKKNEMENLSIDIIDIYKMGKDIESIKKRYPSINIKIDVIDDYTRINISDKVNIITPGLNLVLGNPYIVKVERFIPNV